MNPARRDKRRQEVTAEIKVLQLPATYLAPLRAGARALGLYANDALFEMEVRHMTESFGLYA